MLIIEQMNQFDVSPRNYGNHINNNSVKNSPNSSITEKTRCHDANFVLTGTTVQTIFDATNDSKSGNMMIILNPLWSFLVLENGWLLIPFLLADFPSLYLLIFVFDKSG